MVADSTGQSRQADDGRKSPRAKRDDAATRQCAISRQHRPLQELIRFVEAPGGSIVADLKRCLPGRGVWITADQTHLAKAIQQAAFQRSLKRPVKAAPELTAQVESQLLKKALDGLSLANKAGLIVTGFTKVEQAIAAGRLAALLHGCDAAPDGCQKLSKKFLHIQGDRRLPAPIVTALTISEMSLAIGRTNVVHAGLKIGGMTDTFLSDVQRLERFRLGVAKTADTPMEQLNERIDG